MMISKGLKVHFNGWYCEQLKMQAKSLFGVLDEVWNDIKDSKWIGGISEGWERLPYYLNGLIPLAYALDDNELIQKSKKYIDIIINLQREDGKICPQNDTDAAALDLWSLFLVLKVLTIYAELSDDERIIPVLKKALNYIDLYLRGNTIFNWGHARYFECFIPILYLKKRISSSKYQKFLIALTHKLASQGLDYQEAAKLWDEVHHYWSYDTHGVNIAMALKAQALYAAITGEKHGISAEDMLKILDEKHGTCYGHFTSDECLAGPSPYQGAELCGVVEAMYSYEILFSLTKNPYWIERLEKLAYNGLAATMTDDMWAHQYDQQVNQIVCKPLEGKIPFITNGNEANVFGLEPNYGCCTANFGQGWPLMAFTCFEKTKTGIKIHIPLAAKISCEDYTLEIKTDYPFKKTVCLKADNDIMVMLKVPFGAKVKGYRKKHGYIYVNLQKDVDTIITYQYEPKLTLRSTGLSVLNYGPLVFALPIDYETCIKEYISNNVERKYPYCDYYFIPKTEWRYAFNSHQFKVIEMPFKKAFDRQNPPLFIETKMIRVAWKYQKGSQAALKNKPDKFLKTTKNVKLQPYGATYLRMTEMLDARDNK